MPFDTLQDLAPVSLVATVPMFLVVGPATKANDVTTLAAEARANPGKLAIAANSLASASHLAAELFKSRADIDMTTVVYKGSAPALTDIMGGRVAAMFDTVPGAIAYVKSGQLRAIAVGGAKRLAILPDVPTLQESGLKDIEIRSWYGVIAPARTPPGDRRAPQPRDRRDHALGRHARADGRADARAGRQHARRVLDVHPSRDGRLGTGGEGREDQARMTTPSRLQAAPRAMTIDVARLKSWPFPDVETTYTDRDTMLYALCVGAGRDPLDPVDLRFAYEAALQALPTMAVVLGYPGSWMNDPASGIDYRRVVHGENALTIHHPLPPAGTVVGRTRVTRIVDKGAGKGAVVTAERTITDKASGHATRDRPST